MREIKFRAWDKLNKAMHLFDFSGQTIYAYEGEVCGIILPDMQTTLMYNKTGLNEDLELMQYTGLKDKKRTKEFPEGQEIYEHDLFMNGESLRVIKFSNGNFHAQTLDGKFSILLSFIYKNKRNSVVGNIHENPELL